MPPARKDEVVDDYHGTSIADPYRWLEDSQSLETQAWVAAQQEMTARFLEGAPDRTRFKERLTELWDYPRYSVPERRGDRYFFFKNDGLQAQAVLYQQEGLDGTPVPLLDPNTLSPDGTIALGSLAFNEQGTQLAYGLSTSGSDWQEVRVRDLATGQDGPEVLRWCKFVGLAWKRDGSGFFYNRLPEPGTVAEEDQNSYSRVYWHALSTPQAADLLVYERPDARELLFRPFVTEDGRYLLLYVSHGTSPKNRIYYRPLEGESPVIRLLDEADAHYEPLGNDGSTLYVLTDLDAPQRRIVAIDLQDPARERWREILPQRAMTIDFAELVHDYLVVVYLQDASHRLRLFDRQGTDLGEITLPDLGTISALGGRRADSELFIGFSSFFQPPTVLRYDFLAGDLSVYRTPALSFDVDAYQVRQVFYPSLTDGTRIPLFITHKRGLALDGSHPTILYGYGGFNQSLTPTFSAFRLAWLECGGVYAVANVRGGGEYGEAWHEAGMLQHKQRVFDDFSAAARWLVSRGYTSVSKLAIQGGSNGGLLVAACMLQHPTWFGAVICQVPVLDMLRYHKFTVGAYWVPEYGNAEDDPEAFRYLLAYSPLHTIQPGVEYPPILITTADTDDRVSPAHARKFVAALQAARARDTPILLRVETRAGHGAGKPTAKVIDEQSDSYAFLCKVFGREHSAPEYR